MSIQDVVYRRNACTRKHIASSLRKHREARGWSKSRLGREAGIGERNIGHWERERGEPDITAFIKLANALEVSLEALAGIDR